MCHCCKREPAHLIHKCRRFVPFSNANLISEMVRGGWEQFFRENVFGTSLRRWVSMSFGDLVVTSRGVHLIQRMGWCWFWLRNESLKQKKARVADLKRGAAAVLAWQWAIGWENGIWGFNQDWENWIAFGRFKQSWKQQEFDKLVGTFTAQAVLDNVPDPTASLRPFLLSPRFTAWRSTPESGMQATDLWH